MPVALLRPQDRYCLIGKTRSGKTALAMVLAGTFARILAPPWEVWWIDTKNDPDDLAALRQWGFTNASSEEDRQNSNLKNALYFIIHSQDTDSGRVSVVEQAQSIFRAAYNRKHVLLVVDEYVQVCPSTVNAGAALLDVFQRGGGRNVGLIGLTQEPVYVPRQLKSQATHLVLLSLTYDHDIEHVKKMVKTYENPQEVLGDPYGFWWKWADGGGEIVYYPNQKVWYDTVQTAFRREDWEARTQPPKQEGVY